jgi:dolichyl-phosphate beta-glucosyltransferase
MDGDLAYSLEHLEPLVEKLKEFDVVIGCINLERVKFRNLTLLRKISCQIFNFISGEILNLPYRDMQAGLKKFNKIPAQKIFKRPTLTGFSVEAKQLFLAK